MSGRINRINDALANSSIMLIGSVEPIAGAIVETAEGVKSAATSFKHGAQGAAIWTKDWRDAQDEMSATRRLERALVHDERLRAVTLNREAFDALQEAS